MSVLIRGMEMPKNGHECRLYEGDIYYCSAADKMLDILDSSAEKCQFCPLTEVPPFSRLIDADEAYDKIAEAAGEGSGNYVDMDVVDRGLSETPTIIEAEEET